MKSAKFTTQYKQGHPVIPLREQDGSLIQYNVVSDAEDGATVHVVVTASDSMIEEMKQPGNPWTWIADIQP